MSQRLPLKLDGRVTLKGNTLLFNIQSAVFSLRLAEEAAEWVREDVIGGGSRREEHVVSPVAMTLTEKGIQIAIGGGAQKYPLFHTVQSYGRGILLDRQTAANNGQVGLWTVVSL